MPSRKRPPRKQKVKISSKIDETGNRYGRLLVISESLYKSGTTSATWLCKCDCGKYTTVRGTTLRSGGTLSCGCYRNERSRIVNLGRPMSKRHRKIVSEVNKIDETGNRYTRLLVLSEVPRKRRNNAVCWRCLCDCGKYVIARGADLRYGATKSCGCLKAKKGYKRAYRPDGTFYFVKPENYPAPLPCERLINAAQNR